MSSGMIFSVKRQSGETLYSKTAFRLFMLLNRSAAVGAWWVFQLSLIEIRLFFSDSTVSIINDRVAANTLPCH